MVGKCSFGKKDLVPFKELVHNVILWGIFASVKIEDNKDLKSIIYIV
jgi:hypothetical protein